MNKKPQHIDHNFLWSQFTNGDKESFSNLYAFYIDALFNYGKQISQDENLVKDSIQDLFVELWQNREKLGHVLSVQAYLLKSIRYKLIKQQKKNLLTVTDEKEKFQLDFSIENKMIREETNLEILACLKKNVNQLTYQQREVIFHIIYHDMSYEETAAIMEVSKKTVYNLFSAALISLREKVKKDYPHKIQLAELLLLMITTCTIS